MPDFLTIVGEITDDETYCSKNLAKLDFKMPPDMKELLAIPPVPA